MNLIKTNLKGVQKSKREKCLENNGDSTNDLSSFKAYCCTFLLLNLLFAPNDWMWMNFKGNDRWNG